MKNIKDLLTRLAVTAAMIMLSVLFIAKSLELNFIQDDAFTSLRYVKNFVDGHGLVFNLGERVEGYTNFLWVIILSGFYALQKNGFLNTDLVLIAQYLSLSFGVATLWITYSLSKTFFRTTNVFQNIFALLPVYLMAVSGPFIYWGVSGMETSLFVFLTLLSFYLYQKRIEVQSFGNGFVFVTILNSLLRPEGLILFGLMYLHKIIATSHGKNILTRFKQAHSKKIIVELSILVLFAAVYTIFRVIYFGYPLPNTFYAKTGFTLELFQRGIRYLLLFAEENLLYGFMLIMPFANLLSNQKKRFVFFYYIILAWTLLVVLIGGDVLPVHRFFLHVLPLIFILNIKAFDIFIDRFNNNTFKNVAKITTSVAVVFYAVWNFEIQLPAINNFKGYESGLVKKMRIYADWFNNHHQNNAEIINSGDKSGNTINVAMSTIGAFSFYSSANVIDIVGLTDEFIAHNPKEVKGIDNELPVLWKERRYNADYVMLRNPDYIIFPAGAKPSAFAECALFVHEDFLKNYYQQLIYSPELNQLLPVFTRRKNPLILASGNNSVCNVKFVKYIIEANNLFLNMLQSGNYKILHEITAKCDSAIYNCNQRSGEANTIKGYSYYHSKKIREAKLFLTRSIEADSLNMTARFYLKKIFLEEGDSLNAARQFRYLTKYSPGISILY